MKDLNNSAFSLESIAFLLRKPWLFICPVVIISSIVFAFISNTTIYYKVNSVISFERAGEKILDTGSISKKEDLIGKVLLGDNIRMIIKEVWPELREEAEPLRYSQLIDRLRDPKNGIQLKFERDPRLLSISFQDPDPNICYKVVQATINTIIRENKKEVEQRLETGLSFLKSQVELYRDKLQTIDEELITIRNELKSSLPQLTPSEKELVRSLIGESALSESKSEMSPAVQKSLKYEEILTELNLQLLDEEKKKERLQEQIRKGTYLTGSSSGIDYRQDPSLNEYDKAITAKEIAIANLFSQGYMPAHPEVVKLKSEIENLKVAKESRIAELKEQATKPGTFKLEIEEKLKQELNEIEFQIDALKDKIKLVEKYRDSTEGQIKKAEIQNIAISKKVSKLIELQNEKEISTKYYSDLRKELEGVELKNRLEKEKAGFNITVAEPPTVPLKPVPFQKLPKLLMGFLFSLGVGGGLAYIVDSLDNPVRTGVELRELLRVPVLASIDKINTAGEIRFKILRRNAIIAGLIGFIIFSQIAIKILFFIKK